MIYDTIAPCKKKKGYEGVPEEFYNVSLEDLKDTLLQDLNSYQILRETKVMLVFKEKAGKNKISIFPSLRVFVHGDLKEEEATSIFDTISKSVKKITAS